MLLAQLLVVLGDKEAGIAEANRAAELLSESRDAYDGPQITIGLAQVLAWAGENDRALELIKRFALHSERRDRVALETRSVAGIRCGVIRVFSS